MIDIEQFNNALTAARKDRAAGRLRIGLHVDDKLCFATLFFAEGQIRDCEFLDGSGKPAINDLLGHAIVSCVFIRGEVPADCENSTIPDVDTLISMVRERQVEKAEPALEPRDLTGIAIDLLEEYIGKRAAVLVADIARRNPPEGAAKEFLRECETLGAEFVGARQA